MREPKRQRPDGRRDTPANVVAPLVVDEDAAAALLGLSPRTLQRWRVESRGPAFVRVGKRRMYRPSDLARFVEAGLVRGEVA